MKKIIILIIGAGFLLGTIWSVPSLKENIQVNKYKIPLRTAKLPHLRIVLPTENYVYELPGAIIFKAKLTRRSKVRFEIRNSIGKLLKVAFIEEADLTQLGPVTYAGQVKIKLKVGKYYVIGAPQTNMTPETKAVGPIHFSVIIRKQAMRPFYFIKINSPVKGKTYYIGTKVPILWETEKIKKYGTVHLQICWPDGSPAAGTFPVKNDGSHEWVVNETKENSLRLKIFTHDKKFSGMTGVFRVKFPIRKKMVIKKR